MIPRRSVINSFLLTEPGILCILFEEVISKKTHAMKPTVYNETSIPGFYYENRAEPSMIARKAWTRQWWDHQGHDYILFTSEAVLEELQRGDYPNKDKTIALMEEIRLIHIDPAIIEIVQTYIDHNVMPRDPTGDALHLAVASYHKCDFLLTWNCNHLANANKFNHIRRINTMIGLYVPILTTPLEMLGGEII
jgi:predicted nucleic acid-binding protein